MRWSWNCGAVVIPVVFSDPWTPSLHISPIFRPATSVVPMDQRGEPERRTRRTKRLIPTDHRLFQARVPQFADNVNSHPVLLMATHSRIQFAEGPKERLRGPAASPVASQVINHRAISRRISVRGQCELTPNFVRTWRPTPGSRPPKGRRKYSGVTATRLPGDESPDDIPKASSCQTQHGQR